MIACLFPRMVTVSMTSHIVFIHYRVTQWTQPFFIAFTRFGVYMNVLTEVVDVHIFMCSPASCKHSGDLNFVFLLLVCFCFLSSVVIFVFNLLISLCYSLASELCRMFRVTHQREFFFLFSSASTAVTEESRDVEMAANQLKRFQLFFFVKTTD